MATMDDDITMSKIRNRSLALLYNSCFALVVVYARVFNSAGPLGLDGLRR